MMATTLRHAAVDWAVAAVFFAVPAHTQTTPIARPIAAAAMNSAAEIPAYISIPLEISVDRPAGEVWSRIASYCTVARVLSMDCKIIVGREGEIGAVRQIGGAVEVIVGRTALSYTYAAAPRAGQPYNMYHATLEVRPITPATSKILYTLMY